MEPVLKAARATPRIGTHDGVFHCDEVLACFMLKLLPQYKTAEIVRTRDDAVLDKCDVVVDVGGKYDPSNHRYDHHQREFQETASSLMPGKPWNIRLSSAGLVYCHFGREVIKQLVPDLKTDKDVEPIFNYVYERFVQEIDAIDNGVPMFEGEPRYRISSNLSSRVGYLNPPWNAPPEDPKSMDRFEKATKLVGSEFVDRVTYASGAWWPARKYVLDAINSRFQIHPSGQIMELEQFCPWKEHYFDLMKELQLDPSSINFMIFNGGGDTWRVQGVPESATSFVGKLFLHPEWRGLRDAELSKLSGIDGCVFAHASGFIGGNKTRDGALQMAIKSLDQPLPSNE
ncbi:UPF0160 protein MYG1, mitochondrial [Thrips palmi]|uniref:UPF0160 protein MYG1, mitochondrial n=1 Tax=Thrips palmi TaxID=161013 RepID=A0A6P8Z6A5_THRPL|nr:UPF0160 protein MYG1, mitochondrial [Thrips palmi]XP_034245447.1 UPF0160 protein MYG1, mitochondrial [Thrips palmi]XP_034245448.1 UPF0160 protein MYG1, mitochondrial [Thrips palmi]